MIADRWQPQLRNGIVVLLKIQPEIQPKIQNPTRLQQRHFGYSTEIQPKSNTHFFSTIAVGHKCRSQPSPSPSPSSWHECSLDSSTYPHFSICQSLFLIQSPFTALHSSSCFSATWISHQPRRKTKSLRVLALWSNLRPKNSILTYDSH